MKIDVQLRRARSQDMVHCAAILNQWIDETAWMPRQHAAEDVVRYHEKEIMGKREVWVVASSNRIAGFMALAPDHVVTALYVGSGFRRQGVGHLLLDQAKRTCGTDLRLWTFQQNEAAQKFYAHEDFIEIQRTDGDNDEGLPDLLLEWRA